MFVCVLFTGVAFLGVVSGRGDLEVAFLDGVRLISLESDVVADDDACGLVNVLGVLRRDTVLLASDLSRYS